MEKFWKFCNQTETSAELFLYGDISDTSWWGDEVTPKQFADELNALGTLSEITVRINSGGGDVFAAAAIGNLLEQNPATVTAKIDGLCASAATIVACHCSKVIAANDSTYMIHPVKMGLCGYIDAVTMQQYLDALGAIRDSIVTLYVKKTGRCRDEVAAQMDATSWWTGAEAKENGFVDELVDDGEETVIENRGGFLFVNSVGTRLHFNETPFVQKHQTTVPGVGWFVNKNAGGKPENKEENGMEIRNVNDLRKAYPELVGEIEAAAAEQATNAERQRIRDIEEMSLPGSEELMNDAKYEHPVGAADFAKQAIKNAKKAEDEKKQKYLNGILTDVAGSGMNGVAGEPQMTSGDEFMDALKSVGQK